MFTDGSAKINTHVCFRIIYNNYAPPAVVGPLPPRWEKFESA